jgi:hypothetical protein
MKHLFAASALVFLPGCLAASVAGATVGVIGEGVELAGKTVYYTGKGAVALVSGSGDSVPVTVAEDIGDIERGRLHLTVRFRDGGEMYASDRVIPARALEDELDALSRRDDVVDVYIDRP